MFWKHALVRPRLGRGAAGRRPVGIAGAEQPTGLETFAPLSPELRKAQDLQARMVSRIQEALHHDEVRVDYQPIFDLSSGLVVCAEALVRLTDADGRPIPPAQLIPAAEASGLIVELGRRVLRLAALQAARWREEHGVLLPIAVNVSAAQLTQPGFSQAVLDAVEDAGVPPEALLIELTESLLLDTGSGGMEQLRQLSAAGIELAIDDFGTGYASLSLLHDLPACTLKIDRSFVAGIPDDHRAVAIVSGVIGLARNFDMICIAEGIESETQLAYLAERGVYGQGFLLGRPDHASVVGWIIANGGTALPLSAAQ
jgi:EAL domain-containing protein (putative c-di-GMP-specific phosphodiesterase class I)